MQRGKSFAAFLGSFPKVALVLGQTVASPKHPAEIAETQWRLLKQFKTFSDLPRVDASP